jgi:hypothetical protein
MAKKAPANPVRDEEKALRQRWRPADISGLQVLDAGWNYDDAQAALKLQSSLKRHGQFRPVLCVTPPDGSTVVVDGRRLLAAMKALGLQRAMICDLGEVEAADIAALRLACELRFEVDYARLAKAVHGFLQQGTTVDRLASAGPFSADRIGYFNTLATFDWKQFSEAAEDDGQTAMEWDALDDLPPHVAPLEAVEPPHVPAAIAPPEPEPEALPEPAPAAAAAPPAEAPAPAAEPAAAAPAAVKGGKKKAPAPPPGPSLFDDLEDDAVA